MRGPVPLGYGVRERMLVVNDAEPAMVRRLFDDFVTMRSATLMVKAYSAEGLVTKGGKRFTGEKIYKKMLQELAGESTLGTIGAELQEWAV